MRHFKLFNLKFVSTIIVLLLVSAGCSSIGYPKSTAYERPTIEEWQTYVSPEYRRRPSKKEKMLNEVKRQLAAIREVVPEPALSKIMQTPIWVEYYDPPHWLGRYLHADHEVFRDGNASPDKRQAVILTYGIYTHKDSDPWVILHELAHAYHWKCITRQNRVVLDAYENAVASGKYEAVLHYGSDIKKTWGIKSDSEYFAELTEAYFGYNSIQPSTREELQEFDPVGYEMIERIWKLGADELVC